MVNRPCPGCGSRDDSRIFVDSNFDEKRLDEFAFSSRKLPDYAHHRLVACPECDLLYASPIPTVSELAQAYHEAAFDSSEESVFAARTYASFLPAIARTLPDLAAALDIGTGDGAFLEQLLAAGFQRVQGVEPSKAPVAAAKEVVRSRIRQGMFEARDFPELSFSLITCFQTLEHLYEPRQFCLDVGRLLRPGGAVFFICHDRRALSARLLGLKSPIIDIEHMQLFSFASIRFLLEQTGFQQVKVESVWNRYPLCYWVKLFPFPGRFKSRIIAFLKRTGIGQWPISIPAGNMVAIGYKN